MHNLKVGCADCSVIQTTETFLLDCHNIEEHSHLLPDSKRLRGVFITHQHSDHYSGLEYLRRKKYSIEFLVCSPYDRRVGDTSVTLDEWNECADHVEYFKTNGSKVHYPYQQEKWDKPWWETAGLRFWMLGPTRATADAHTREIHDACLVFQVNMGERKCVFTGDASDLNLQDVAGVNHICGDILHASHHGSLNGADLSFIKKCAPKYTVISTATGVHDNVPHPTALKRYADNTTTRVYRTDQDGSLKWSF